MSKEFSSFRDPTAQVFQDNLGYLRQIYPGYWKEYDHFMKSGLYDDLLQNHLIIPHEEVGRDANDITIKPETVPFVSYPWEWSFSTLKEAALNCLEVNSIARAHGMMLKDAPAFNFQYHEGEMKLIDTTSFMFYEPGMPWGSYPQFISHFLCPLLLIKYRGHGVSRLNLTCLDGIPLPLTAHLLPKHLKFRFNLIAHLYSQVWNPKLPNLPTDKPVTMSKIALDALLGSLEQTIKGLKYDGYSSWLKYKDAGSYTEAELADKKAIVNRYLRLIRPGTVCDLGSNLGEYSELAGAAGHKVISVDSSHDCINAQYGRDWLSLVIDLMNPSPAVGWENQERRSFLDRLHVDTILALALIHHLCIRNNVPLERVAAMFAKHCINLIVEYVPPTDKQAKKLAGTKNFPAYNKDVFLDAFAKYFELEEGHELANGRTLYYLKLWDWIKEVRG